MEDPKEALIRDLVATLRQPRPYTQVIEAWRTSCPRLTVWEDAVDRGLVALETVAGALMVRATQQGQALIQPAAD